MPTSHPELEIEQDYIRAAYDVFQQQSENLKRQAEAGADRHSARALRKYADSTLESRDAGRSFCVGRIDMVDGDVRYIGKNLVHDGESPLIISWKAKKAEPYYKARQSEPMAVHMRRRFTLDDELRLREIEDQILAQISKDEAPQVEDVSADASSQDAPASPIDGELEIVARGTHDAILAEMESARAAEMRDIVATIQADQYDQISDGLEGVLAIQGGPGTGKTAVLLHRAAYLLFNFSDELSRQGVLVVGPNRAFMGYVAKVLPSLGETQVDQSTVHHLVSSVRAKQVEPDHDVARIKGDPRMASVVKRAIEDRIRVPEHGLRLTFEGREFEISAADIQGLVDASRGSGSYSAANKKFRRDMLALAFQRYLDAGPQQPAHVELGFHEALGRTNEWRNALERIWPVVSAIEVIRDLFDNKGRLERVGENLLEEDEIELLRRERRKALKDEPWTYSDLPLVDEAHSVLEGVDESYGYVLVDEAQDLTPMQLRMVGRRARGGRLTVSGDLAQCTGVWKYQSWNEISSQLAVQSELRVSELLYAYRVPAPVMDLAGQLLSEIAPQVNAPKPVRDGNDARFVEVDADDVATTIVLEYLNNSELERTTGVIAPQDMHAAIRHEFEQELIAIGDSVNDGLKRQVTLITPELVKGLEFDDVIVVEPAQIVEDEGLAGLYVAMTRPTRNLTLIHSEPLPSPLLTDDDDDSLLPENGGMPPTLRPPLREPKLQDASDLSARYSEALMHAKFLHSGQARPGTTTPRFAHLLAVSSMVIEDGGTEDEAIAALLHDSVQHRGFDHLESIRVQFGDRVAGIVEACTDPAIPPGDEWRRYRETRLEQLMGAPPSVCRVVLAEKIDNLRSIIRDLRNFGPSVFKREEVPNPEELVWWFGELAALFKQEHPGSLADELHDVFEEFEQLLEDRALVS